MLEGKKRGRRNSLWIFCSLIKILKGPVGISGYQIFYHGKEFSECNIKPTDREDSGGHLESKLLQCRSYNLSLKGGWCSLHKQLGGSPSSKHADKQRLWQDYCPSELKTAQGKSEWKDGYPLSKRRPGTHLWLTSPPGRIRGGKPKIWLDLNLKSLRNH